MDEHTQKLLREFLSQTQSRTSTFHAARDQVQTGLDAAASGLAAVSAAVAKSTATLEYHTAQIREILNETQDKEIQKLQAEKQLLVQTLSETTEKSKNQKRIVEGFLRKQGISSVEEPDSNVQGTLEWIKARIETIVKKTCIGEGKTVNKNLPEFANLDAEWAKKEKDIVKRGFNKDDVQACRIYWLQTQFYKILERDIFSAPVFGLDADMEEILAQFEKLIAFHNPHTTTSDWRTLTLRYSKAVKSTHTALPTRTAQHISNLFLPWTRGNKASEVLLELKELCQIAYDWAVMVRRSADKYVILSIEEGTRYEGHQPGEEFVPSYIFGPKQQHTGSKVWATVFGGLVKETLAGDRFVMMKANVICMV
ncbi:hypothetical protein H2200_001727 [Cladophialophora chaetospira]|uniref:Uncharacterized protein n=1 Tax=Cladophialophora chaetospira TaxID=386627 RepID=A0AA38XLH6_9EURO|nr:hypothetical protein H2200_001727 [Cladophialophora chaetospira]